MRPTAGKIVLFFVGLGLARREMDAHGIVSEDTIAAM
jgi:hypothetical protein